jgi:hypothetical protein
VVRWRVDDLLSGWGHFDAVIDVTEARQFTRRGVLLYRMAAVTRSTRDTCARLSMAMPRLRATSSRLILGLAKAALANALNRNENQTTSGYRWRVPVRLRNHPAGIASIRVGEQ